MADGHAPITGLSYCVVCDYPYEPHNSQQVTCGQSDCRWKRWEGMRDKVKQAINARARSRVWDAAHGRSRSSRPWLAGAPPYGSHLPGGACGISLDPLPERKILLQHARLLHGLVTSVTGEPHHRNLPPFSLIPAETQSGWGVWFRSEATARRIVNTSHEAHIAGRPTQVRFGFLSRLRAPDFRYVPRGHRTVKIDAVTPVSIKSGDGTTQYTKPTAQNFVSTLRESLAARIDCEHMVPESLRLEIVESHTVPEIVDCGEHWGSIHGWIGHVIVDANAPVRWLLACAERVGLGGRTALGFGRIRLTEVK